MFNAAVNLEDFFADHITRRRGRSRNDGGRLTSRRYAVNYQVGAEFGHLEQDFTQTGIFGGGQSGTIDTSTDITFDGGGLKAGIDGEQRLCCGFFAYGKATAAALSGRFDSHYNMFNSTSQTLLARCLTR